jgi:PST family polysaccharide transporter
VEFLDLELLDLGIHEPDSLVAVNPPSDHDLTDRAASGVRWSALSRVLIQVVQFGSTLVMARLLVPSEFGLVAIVTSLVNFASLFTDLGLGAALIHEQNRATERFQSTAFWLNALTGFALTGLLCAVARPLADFFGYPELQPLFIVGSLVFSISMYTVQLALLEKELRFRLIGAIEVAAVAVGVVVSISCAAAGVGAMSLVLGSVTQALVTTALMWIAVRWRPKRFMDRESLGRIWRYSGHLFGFNVINYWSRNLDDLLIGKYGSAAELGFYSRAYLFMLLPVVQVGQVMGRVLFPALARLQHDRERLRGAYVRALALMIAVTAPVTLWLSAAAGPFVDVLFGSRWHQVAPLLTILAASGPAQLVGSTAGALYQSIGATRQLFWRGVVSAAVTIVAIVIGLQWGATGVAVAILVKFYLLMPYNVGAAWRRIALKPMAGARAVAAPMSCSLAMAFCTAALGIGLHGSVPSSVILALQIIVGASVYIGLLWLVAAPLLKDVVHVTAVDQIAGRLRSRHLTKS